MSGNYTKDKNFNGGEIPFRGEYENCTFNNIDFGDYNLSDFVFADCTFTSCNLSMAKLSKTAFRQVKFIECKMLGLQFDTCNPFGFSVSFDSCLLNHASFFKMNIRKTIFKNTSLLEVDFAESDLSEAVFAHCDLSMANFDHTVLEKTDFTTAGYYSIDPENNRIKQAKFSIHGIAGLLQKYNIEIIT